MFQSSLHADLVEMLEAMRVAEAGVFGAVRVERRETPGVGGGWSAKDVWAHLAAWRSIEARRLEAAARGESGVVGDDPAPGDPIAESNQRLNALYADWSWEAVEREAGASVDALIRVIRRSSIAMLCDTDGIIAGIGSNGVNHAIGHLPEIAAEAGRPEPLDTLAAATETILRRDRLPPRDSGVILYNIACHRALAGELDEGRRLLREAFARRDDLLELAAEDPDLVSLRGELEDLARPG